MKTSKQEHPETKYIEPSGFKGTKWEWYVATDHDRRVGSLPNTLIIGNGNTVANCSPNVLLPKEEREANAKLISQSKNMARALQDMIEVNKKLMHDEQITNAAAVLGKHELMREMAKCFLDSQQVLKEAGLISGDQT